MCTSNINLFLSQRCRYSDSVKSWDKSHRASVGSNISAIDPLQQYHIPLFPATYCQFRSAIIYLCFPLFHFNFDGTLILKYRAAELQHLSTGYILGMSLFILRIQHLKQAPSFGPLPVRHRLVFGLSVSDSISATAVSECSCGCDSQSRLGLLLLQVAKVLTRGACR